mgnify:CR=1 FL=1
MKKTFILFITLLFAYANYAQTTHTINAGSYYYSPSDLTINQGDIVTWINDGGLHDEILALAGEG